MRTLSENNTAEAVETVEEQQAPEQRYVSPRETASYCLTYMGISALDKFMSAQKQTFMMTFLGLTGTQYGVMTTISSAWDAIDDPVSGVVIDRLRTRWGRLRPFLILPIPFWAIGAILMFTIPTGFTSTQKFLYATILTIIYGIGVSYRTGWTLLLYNMTPNRQEQTSLVATQQFVNLFNYLPSLMKVFVDIIPKITNNAVVMSDVYTFGAYFFVIIAAAACVFGFFSMRERVPQTTSEEQSETSILSSFVYAIKNKPFLALVVAWFFGNVASVKGSAGEDYFWINCMGSLSLEFTASLFTGLPGYVTTPLAPKIIKRFGVRNTNIGGSAFSAITWGLLYLIGYNPFKSSVANFAWVTAMMTLAGAPVRVNRVCEPLLLGDLYDYLEWKNGVRNEGVVSAVSSYAQKLSSSVIGLFSGVIYDIIGFTPQKDSYGNVVPHSDAKVKQSLFGVFTLFPMISWAGYAISLLFFKVNGKFKQQMLKELAEQRAERAKRNSSTDNEDETEEPTE